MKKDDPKKPLPRPEWSDDDARRREQERVSQLLDAESGSASTGGPEAPEPGEVYGMPPDDADLAPVYGMPEDDEPAPVRAMRPVYGLPAPSNEPPRMTVYGGPTIGRRASSRAGLLIGLAALAVGALALWWFLR